MESLYFIIEPGRVELLIGIVDAIGRPGGEGWSHVLSDVLEFTK